MAKKLLLGVNIDHIATLRQARLEKFPSVIQAARVCEKAGAAQITVHLREDRRHIQDHDVFELKRIISGQLNLEMACYDEIVNIACRLRPRQATLVPEKRREVTTEGGLDVVKNFNAVAGTVEKLQKKKIRVSLFIDPDLEQVEMALRTGAEFIELHTGSFANAASKAKAQKELMKLIDASVFANALGLGVNAGHGIDYNNIKSILKIPHMHELNIGFSIIAESLFIGLDKAVKKMIKLMKQYKG
ncbi:MAG: pyridoxine 5'-phosphate synthase [Candidatus Aureabacteria bacterium]|nr:pyridoxine 5'-phosphate synthase [Candidatus Auribacterota bacterium]